MRQSGEEYQVKVNLRMICCRKSLAELFHELSILRKMTIEYILSDSGNRMLIHLWWMRIRQWIVVITYANET